MPKNTEVINIYFLLPYTQTIISLCAPVGHSLPNSMKEAYFCTRSSSYLSRIGGPYEKEVAPVNGPPVSMPSATQLCRFS